VMKDLLRILEVAYDFDAPDEVSWLARVASAVRTQLDLEGGIVALWFRLAGDSITPRAVVPVGTVADFADQLLCPPGMSVDSWRTVAALLRRPGVSLATDWAGEAFWKDPVFFPNYRRLIHDRGFVDVLMINAVDAEAGESDCMFFAPLRAVPSISARCASQYARLAAHISAGFRLFRALKRGSASRGMPPEQEDVQSPDAETVCAKAAATATTARAALREAVVVLDRGEGGLRPCNPEDARATWEDLVAGRFSLVDRFDVGGRRYVVARKNDPGKLDLRALTLRETQVVALAASGQSNKLIAYRLRVSSSTVGVLLARAKAKLGVATRAQLVTSLPVGFLGDRRVAPGSAEPS
jgi:DNA-binding CsgD family transcriptional regulator